LLKDDRHLVGFVRQSTVDAIVVVDLLVHDFDNVFSSQANGVVLGSEQRHFDSGNVEFGSDGDVLGESIGGGECSWNPVPK
jgi:hypothetical protein